MSDVHPAAQRGFSEAAEVYRRGRPEYPTELRDWLVDALRLGPGKEALDLGAGTGKFTRLLFDTGAGVVAVEPVDAMRAELAAALPQVRSIAGTAQAMAVCAQSIDAVVCAQSFHWFASGASLEEIHRVLRPGGVLGLVWNVRDESVGWVADITKLLTAYEGTAPRFHAERWRHAFDGDLFTSLVETRFTYRHVGSPRQVIVDRFMSVSFIAALPVAEKSRFAERLETLIATHPDLAGQATVEMPYQTRAFHCSRR